MMQNAASVIFIILILVGSQSRLKLLCGSCFPRLSASGVAILHLFVITVALQKKDHGSRYLYAG